MLQFTGKIVKINPTKQVSEKFQKQEFVLTDGGTYPQLIQFQLTQKNCGLLDDCNVGDEITVTFGLKGREYNGKYFTNLDAFRIKKESKAPIHFQPVVDNNLPF